MDMETKEIKALAFKTHPQFKKQDIEERTELVKNICKQVWSSDYFAKETQTSS